MKYSVKCYQKVTLPISQKIKPCSEIYQIQNLLDFE